MSNGTAGQIDPYDGMDLGAYRYAVARLVRLLIRARLLQEPEFLGRDDRRRWDEETIEGGSRTIESLLQEVVRANEYLYNNVLGPGISTGIAPGDPRCQLKEAVVAMMTSLWSLSNEWIDMARNGKRLDWDEIIPIDRVRVIRDGLDSLPHPPRKTMGNPDGPVPPLSFRWRGRKADFTSKPWALVNFLWQQRSYEEGGDTVRRSDCNTIAREVWGDENVALGRAIESAASRATGMFEEAGIPIRLSACKPDDKHRYVMLVISDSDAKRFSG